MKKIYLGLLFIFAFSCTPALAAAPAKTAWKPLTPKGYSPIVWASAPGISSFFQAPADNGSIDFITRINLPQNQINFILSSSSPKNLETIAAPIGSSSATSSQPAEISASDTNSAIDNYPNLSFKRLASETAKAIDPAIKFLWDAAFFNMKSPYSDLSMAVKYTNGATTTISSGSRSVPDMALKRRMLIINNKTGKAMIKDFDADAFTDKKNGDQAIEGFAPSVAKSDSSGGLAARLFVGVSANSQELIIYCSQGATVKEASNALIAAGAPVDQQLEADGGGSASCGYNLPGQFFVEPARSLPLLMGAKTILARGTVSGSSLNVRSGPGTKYPIVAKLLKGATVQAVEEKSGWYRIGDNEWVLKTLIK
jgi:hypothetical protein